jgi:penicillin amidase
VLAQALAAVAREPDAAWGERHHLVLRHPLAAMFPHEALLAPRDKGPVDGDNETVFTTGCVPHVAGTHAAYASLARYVFDVGNWEACRWVVFHGAAGDPREGDYDNQSDIWRRGETVAMQYDWALVAASAALHTVLQPA